MTTEHSQDRSGIQAPPLVSVRPATVAERSLVAEITQSAYAEYETQSDPSFWKKYEASTRDTLLGDETALRLVAEIAGTIVGAGLLCPPREIVFRNNRLRNIYPEMRLLAVSPQFRNAKVGDSLIRNCEDRTKANGFDFITLHTTVLMQTAKTMYERRGYLRYPEIDFEPTPGFTVWGYRKSLV